jgi:hypothetical protein
MLPLANGVPATGLTWIPDQVMLALLLLAGAVTVIVMELVVTEAVVEATVNFVTDTVTLAFVLKMNPAGAFKMIVPAPISAEVPSARAGPVKLV